MKKYFTFTIAAVVCLLCGCTAVDSANRADAEDICAEGTIVFTRPSRFSPYFGSYSIGELVEITYERAYRNEANQMVVEAGIRYRGYGSWTNWFRNTPQLIKLKGICNFYQNGGIGTPIIYSTNKRDIVINRGETYAFKAVCPVDKAEAYQIVLGD